MTLRPPATAPGALPTTRARRRRLSALVAVVILVAGCAGGSSPDATGPAPPVVSAAPSASSSPSGGPVIGGSPTPPVAIADLRNVTLELREFAGGFEQPLFVTHAGDGSGQVYVVSQAGVVSLVGRDGRPANEPFLDISDRISAGGERGLLGLAFHPGFRVNGRTFVHYTDRDGDTVVAEFRATAARANAGSERVLLRVDQPFANHNGGWIGFGPDRFLYIALGDGGSAGDPMGNGQRKDTLLGKILRIDVDRGDPYGIPADNPFAREQGSRGEIWAYGLRNPWRNSFDRTSGDLFIADVGQGRFEEVDVQPGGRGGLNFGWNVMEGTACFRQERCPRDGLTPPVVAYGRDDGTTITGGYVYRGKEFPFFVGAYVFADYGSGTIWAIRADDALRGPAEPVELSASGRSISSFGEDENGELYLTDHSSGVVFKLVPSVR